MCGGSAAWGASGDAARWKDHPRKARGTANPAERARQSSIGPVMHSAVADDARRLLDGAVDALPEGRLAAAAGRGKAPAGQVRGRPDEPRHPPWPLRRADEAAGLPGCRPHGGVDHRGLHGQGGRPQRARRDRPILSPDEIEANAHTYEEQAFTVLDRERTELRHNSEWLAMTSDELFGLIRRFTVARLLEREDFTQRMRRG